LCSSISGGRQVGAAWIAAMVPAQSYHEMVADALLARPDLLAVARDNALRWLTNGAQAADMLQTWDRLLAQAQAGPDGMAELQRILRSDEPECQRLREFAPLAGMIPREKRRQARDLCGYRH
jgi:hypothetical protein